MRAPATHHVVSTPTCAAPSNLLMAAYLAYSGGLLTAITAIVRYPNLPARLLSCTMHLWSFRTQGAPLCRLVSRKTHPPTLFPGTPSLRGSDALSLRAATHTLEQVRSSQSAVEREFGDDYIFSTALFRTRLHAYRHKTFEEQCESLVAQLHLINMNLSLTHSQTALAEAWQLLLRKTIPYLRGDATVRPLLMTSAASMSYDIAAEKRSGDMMATIHGTRLALLLAVLEVIWFATTDKTAEVASFIELVHNVHNIILNEAQPPSKLFLGAVSVPFHRTLLLILYFSAKNCGILGRRPKALNADQRLKIASMIDTALILVIDALRVVFVSARSRLDVELDRDMELLVSVFDQCTRPDINPSSTLWLIRCQETDIIRGSLDLYVHIDLVGLSDLPLLLARKQPLYAPHVLLFHMTLAGIPSAAERFAGEGVLAAYSNNSLSAAISAGMVDVTLPELPTHRSPAHSTYCSMLGIISGVVTALGRHNHYFDAEASGLIQLYGEQISRALSWTIGDSITLPLVEELEQVVNVFYSLHSSKRAIITKYQFCRGEDFYGVEHEVLDSKIVGGKYALGNITDNEHVLGDIINVPGDRLNDERIEEWLTHQRMSTFPAMHKASSTPSLMSPAAPSLMSPAMYNEVTL
ncbi:hypothetical protein GGX14DRAFT_678304 [Mycena pura]|uniref:Nuclear pore protein Nup188 C-terminal domain-containing protein n=1 Tax=Mycena pura TaxID=153505 RepID=A0AAD6UVS1_9AGAR|nr:hypothetical protein GGX14DRAFT_678304 [Mycena pura]